MKRALKIHNVSLLLTRRIVMFLLFFLPLVLWPFGSYPFETPKIFLFEVLVELMIVLTLVRNHLPKLHVSTTHILLLLIGAVSIIDLLLLRKPNTFLGNPVRLQGIFLLWHLMAFCLIASQIKKIHVPSVLPVLSLALLFAGTIILGENPSGRFYGTLGEPNALAAVTVFLFPFIVYLKNRAHKIIGLSIIAVIQLLANSQAAMIALCIQSVFLLLHEKFQVKQRVTSAICAGLLLASFSLPFLTPALETAQDQVQLSHESRRTIWITAMQAGYEKPIFGHGFGNIEQAIQSTSFRLQNSIHTANVDSSHNIFLDWWAQGGVTGFVLFVILIFGAVKNLLEESKIREVIIFLGILATLSFNPASIASLVILWWIIGQGMSNETSRK